VKTGAPEDFKKGDMFLRCIAGKKRNTPFYFSVDVSRSAQRDFINL